jgi:hypothetical protein
LNTRELLEAGTPILVVVIHMPGGGHELLERNAAAGTGLQVHKLALSRSLDGIEECVRDLGGRPGDDRRTIAEEIDLAWAGLRRLLYGNEEPARPRIVFDVDAWTRWPVISRFEPTAKYLLLTRNCRDTVVSLLRENMFKVQSNGALNYRRMHPGNNVVSNALLWEHQMSRVLRFQEGNLAPHETITCESLAGGSGDALAAIGRLTRHDLREDSEQTGARSSNIVHGTKGIPVEVEAATEIERIIGEALGPLRDHVPSGVYTRLERLNAELGYGALESGVHQSGESELLNMDAFEAIHPGLKLTLDYQLRAQP